MGFEGHGPVPDPMGGLIPQPRPQGGTRIWDLGGAKEERPSEGPPPFRQKHGNGRSAHSTKQRRFPYKNASG